MTDTTPIASSTVNRRQALLAAGALGIAGALAACGGDDSDSDVTGPGGAVDGTSDAGSAGDDADTADPGDDAGEESGEDSDEESGEEPDEDSGDEDSGDEDSGDEDSQPDGDLLAAADEVPVGGGIINGDAQVVVTQPSAGEFKAFSSTCTHEGCQVREVSDGLIRCFCHGSRFFIADGGVENGPATTDLPEIGITVNDGEIFRG